MYPNFFVTYVLDSYRVYCRTFVPMRSEATR